MAQTKNQKEWEQSIEWVGIVAGCVIKRDDKYLLVQEKQAKVYGLWNLPAGYVDKGETIEEAAIREAKEETGYTVRLLEEVGLYHEHLGTPVKHMFRAEIIGGHFVIPEDEILDAQWLSLEEVKVLEKAKKLRKPWIWDVLRRVDRATTANVRMGHRP
jgi:8-oxo-dGTP pyrophosphatase MutT (NUDIX family)